ncbi:MAG: anti-sigma factor RsbA family regulatory protein [Labedaea sp.]
MGVGTEAPNADARFVHPALFYKGLDDYLEGVGGFLQAGLRAGEPVFASVPPVRLTPLREHLGGDANRMHLFDMSEVGRNPGRIMTALTDFAGRRGSGRARMVGEPIWASRTPTEIREATRHEALINLAFAEVPVTILCPYDVNELPAAVLADAERTHPVLWAGQQRAASSAYTDPHQLNAEFDTLLEPEPAGAERHVLTRSELGYLRHRVADFGRAAGLDAERVTDFRQAFAEAAANAIRYGGGSGMVSLWRRPNDVVAQVRDHGRLADPLAGRRRPALDATGGRGLWMIHQMCDLVEFGPGVIRLHLALR